MLIAGKTLNILGGTMPNQGRFSSGLFLGGLSGLIGVLFLAVTVNDDVGVELDQQIKDFAKYGSVDTKMACRATVTFQEKLSEYFENVSDGKQGSFPMTVEECVTAVEASQAKAAQDASGPLPVAPAP